MFLEPLCLMAFTHSYITFMKALAGDFMDNNWYHEPFSA